jgi:5-deoxy-5-amino-3-dehydroquinate dehydratase
MRELLLINGPNLGRLGHRRPEMYGNTSLAEIEAMVRRDDLAPAERLPRLIE